MQDKEFKYDKDFDTNGICYKLGTQFEEDNKWLNPAKQGFIK